MYYGKEGNRYAIQENETADKKKKKKNKKMKLTKRNLGGATTPSMITCAMCTPCG